MPDEADVAAFLEACGPVVPDEDVAVPRAAGLATFLRRRDDVGAQLVECRQSDRRSWLILDVDVDVGQTPRADIRRQESIGVGFAEVDSAWPEVVALRPDFPRQLPHLFFRPRSEPVGLCLTETPWEEVKRRWTPGLFVRALRRWLIDTASGVLHREDQAIEPFLLVSCAHVILPADVLELSLDAPRMLYGYGVDREGSAGPAVYRFVWAPPASVDSLPAFAAVILTTPPRVHGIIPHTPRSLGELAHLLQADDFDFAAVLDGAVQEWFAAGRRDAHPVLLVQVPLLREAGGRIERHDLWPFLMATTVRELGVELDLFSADGGRVLQAFRDPNANGAGIPIEVMNPSFDLTAELAAAYNGYTTPTGQAIVVIGAGALGSQVLSNLARTGEAIAGIVDNDRIFPHNMARHAVWDHKLVGWPKAKAAAFMVERLTPDERKPLALQINAAAPSGDEVAAYTQALADADVILDMAASVPVSRRLALDETSKARRMSAFLNPRGQDLVILCEDRDRMVKLDQLELNYYAAVATDAALVDHLQLPANTRYARSCREVTAHLPQTNVALHAAIAADIVHSRVDDPSALATIWQIDPRTMSVSRNEMDVRPMLEFGSSGWTILVAPQLIESMRAARAARLPAETGGVLLGDFDTSRGRIYLASSIPSPEDSKESPGSYIRGSFGLQKLVEDIGKCTLDMIQYVGEWHSHPDGAGAGPSRDDLVLYGHLSSEMQVEGYPPVMVIVAAEQLGLLVDGKLSTF